MALADEGSTGLLLRPNDPPNRADAPPSGRDPGSAPAPQLNARRPVLAGDRENSGRAPWLIVVTRLGVLALLLALWGLATEHVSRNIIPTPLETLHAAGRLWVEGRLPAALGTSLATYLGGFALAVAVALPLGIVMGAFGLLGRTLEVYIYALAATPRVAFIPLIILFLGLGIEAKLFVVFLGAVMPIVINTYAGVRQADPDLIEMARSVGASRQRIFKAIILPGAVPYVLAGLRIGATIGLINTVVAELYTAVTGLGGLLALYGNTFRMAEYFVIVLTLAAIGVVVTELLRLIELRLTRWAN